MRPPPGGFEERSSPVLMPQTPPQMMPLHPSSPSTPASVAAQGFSATLPLLQMPLLNNERQWQSRTLSRQRINGRRSYRNLETNITSEEMRPPWEQPDRVYETYMSGAEPSRQRVETSTDALNQSILQIESHRSSITNETTTYLCRPTESTQGTNMNQTDSIGIQSEDKSARANNYDSQKLNTLKEENLNSSFEIDSDDDLNLPLGTLRVPSVPKIMQQPTAAAKKLASKIIRHAYQNKIPNQKEMCCLTCGLMPIRPVTGQCGHTRCTKCIVDKGACPCGVPEPESLHVNTVVREIITKMVNHNSLARDRPLPVSTSTARPTAASISASVIVTPQRWSRCNSKRYRRIARSSAIQAGEASRHVADEAQSIPMSIQARYEMGRKLITLGRYREAAPHLAHVAASAEASAKQARTLLAQAITILSRDKDCRRLTRELYRAVRDQAASSWLNECDLECILCCSTFKEPVTTPCGHTYCRTCLERSLDYRKTCALCLRPLHNFTLAMTRDTAFISAALASIGAVRAPPMLDPNLIPIFVCTVAYPTIPCPLFIFDPRYWLMVRRILESGSRKFGMVAYERDRNYCCYGTILKVCDCVHLEDGRSILSTVGVSRFKVIGRDIRDGCDVARIEPLTDIVPTDPLLIWDLRVAAAQICEKAQMWLNSMDVTMYAEIETTFGRIPEMNYLTSNWWETPDGPDWMWWLIAILPLKSEIKILILSTQNLLKRMTAIYRTLEAIDQITMNTPTEVDLTRALNTAEEWLRRTS